MRLSGSHEFVKELLSIWDRNFVSAGPGDSMVLAMFNSVFLTILEPFAIKRRHFIARRVGLALPAQNVELDSEIRHWDFGIMFLGPDIYMLNAILQIALGDNSLRICLSPFAIKNSLLNTLSLRPIAMMTTSPTFANRNDFKISAMHI